LSEEMASKRRNKAIAPVYHGDRLLRRGPPKSARSKEAVSLRIDPDVLARFRATGRGWQTRINDVLKRAAARMAAAQRKG
jgi:uncharacterized protein (DUF4415 family)